MTMLTPIDDDSILTNDVNSVTSLLMIYIILAIKTQRSPLSLLHVIILFVFRIIQNIMQFYQNIVQFHQIIHFPYSC